ncbi:MAG: hypothetical protein ACI9J2_000908 [Saprospiraceae bacterium]
MNILLNEDVHAGSLRQAVYSQINPKILRAEYEEMDGFLSDKYKNTFERVIARHGYLRLFAPALIEHIASVPTLN